MGLMTKAKLGLSVLQYQVTGKSKPIAVAWLITGRCNILCDYCKWKQERSSSELDTATVKDMIDQMYRAGVQLVSFTGGEPLVRKDMGEIIRHVKSYGMVCKLNSNGVMVPRRLDDLRPLDLLQISVDGPPSVMNRLRGEGTSEKAARAIKAAQGEGIRVQLIACLTRDNVARLDEVLDYGLELGVGFCFQVLTTKYLTDNEVANSVPEKADLTNALERLLELKESRDPRAKAIASKRSELEYYLGILKNGSPGCECALVTATMMPDGRLIFCGSAKAGSYESFDAVELGFEEAFSRLAIPDCDGCVCVGKLRISKVYQVDLSIIKEMIGARI
jgi:MoaA/NifB/PqqE/SkfB family radical SAM enzyme